MKEGLVLVVEDEHAIRRLVSLALQGEGLQVIEAETAEDALSKLDTAAPHLVITDIRLPGIDGVELAQRVKARPSANGPVPVILISAYEEPEGHPAEAFIRKPFDLQELVEHVLRRLR